MVVLPCPTSALDPLGARPTKPELLLTAAVAQSIVERIAGRVLRPLEPSLADDDLFDLYAQMGRMLGSFHDVHMEAFGYLVAEGGLDRMRPMKPTRSSSSARS